MKYQIRIGLSLGIITFLSLDLACRHENKINIEVQSMYNQKVIIPIDSFYVIHPHSENHLLHGVDQKQRQRLIVYSDSLVCSSCKILELEKWESFFASKSSYKNVFDAIFIFSPSHIDLEVLKFAIKSQEISFPIYIDTLGVFKKMNHYLPDNSLLHTFLIDKEGKIILVGSPLDNKMIEKMFLEIIGTK